MPSVRYPGEGSARDLGGYPREVIQRHLEFSALLFRGRCDMSQGDAVARGVPIDSAPGFEVTPRLQNAIACVSQVVDGVAVVGEFTHAAIMPQRGEGSVDARDTPLWHRAAASVVDLANVKAPEFFALEGPQPLAKSPDELLGFVGRRYVVGLHVGARVGGEGQSERCHTRTLRDPGEGSGLDGDGHHAARLPPHVVASPAHLERAGRLVGREMEAPGQGRDLPANADPGRYEKRIEELFRRQTVLANQPPETRRPSEAPGPPGWPGTLVRLVAKRLGNERNRCGAVGQGTVALV